jgi:hypothetical protein
LRAALKEAGEGYDPREADVVKTDRKRYTQLYQANPKAGYRMSNDPNI